MNSIGSNAVKYYVYMTEAEFINQTNRVEKKQKHIKVKLKTFSVCKLSDQNMKSSKVWFFFCFSFFFLFNLR